MRIVIVAEDPRITGGIPRYAIGAAEALAGRGEVVHYVYSGGFTNTYDWTLRSRWRESQSRRVTYHQLINPTSIGIHVGAPRLDIDNRDAAVIAKRIQSLQPDLIHAHSFLGVPVRILELLGSGPPIVVSIHDYAVVCQRRDLVRRDGKACATYPKQSDCATCVSRVDPRRYRLRARLRRTPMQAGLRAAHFIEGVTGHDLRVDLPAGGGVQTQPHFQTDEFRERLASSIGLINRHAACVLAVSAGVKSILVTAGVDDSLIEVVHIGSPSAESLPKLPLPCQKTGQVTFMFLGGLIPFKGAHVLMEAAARMEMPPRIVVAGGGYPEYEAHLRRAAPSVVEFLPAFTPREQATLLAQADVVVAPAVGPDPGPQVVMEALAAGRPVIASRIGGIPDFVKDGVNGRLVQPDNPEELAETLDELQDPRLVSRLARRARLPRTVAQHIEDLAKLYAELLADRQWRDAARRYGGRAEGSQ